MLVVGLVPLFGLFAYGYFATRSALIEASDQHLLSVVASRSAQMDSWLSERRTDLEVIGRSPDCNALVVDATVADDHERVCDFLDSFQSGARDYRVISLYNPEWELVASQRDAVGHPEEIVGEDLKTGLSNADGPIFLPTHAHESGYVGVHAANILQIPGRSPSGYVVASLDLARAFAGIIANRAGLGQTGGVTLAGLDGSFVMEETPSGASAVHDAILRAAETSSSGSVHFRSQSGKGMFASFARSSEQGWILVAEMEQEEALALLYSLRQGFVVAGVITLIVVFLLSAQISRRLSTPFAELAAAVRSQRDALPQGRISVHGDTDVAQVTRAFNELLDAVEKAEKDRVLAGTLSAVGELSSSIVHEMRNQLSSVKMNLQALERHLGSEADFAELSGIALSQVRKTEETLTDLLDYARPVAPVIESVSVNGILADLMDRFKAEAVGHGIDLRVVKGASPETIQADKRLLDQAVSNLVLNALQATPRGGVVTLRLVTDLPHRHWLRIEVEDTGPGLNGVDPTEIFRPFFTTKKRGSGLGLAHALKCAELHGGRIFALSGAGGGALFRLEIPCQEVVS